MGKVLSLQGKRIAVTGASGTLGQAFLKHLQQRGAQVLALTSKQQEIVLEDSPIPTLTWQVGYETALSSELEKIDILILNHGINVHGDRTEEAISKSYEINALSSWRLMERFFDTVRSQSEGDGKEIWVNTSEAEVGPALSPLYELSKRTLGDLVTLRRLDAPCVVRKLILGPFKSNLNPVGVMSADWVAQQVLNKAQRDVQNIIVTINPLTFITYPWKEFWLSRYFRWFSQGVEN